MPSMSAYQNILSGNGIPCERESGLTLLNVFVKIGYPRAVSVTTSESGSCVSKKSKMLDLQTLHAQIGKSTQFRSAPPALREENHKAKEAPHML